VAPEIVLDKNSPSGRLMCMAQECGLPLKRHAEISDNITDPYYLEGADLREIEPRFMDTYPNLRRILAHISTEEAVKHMIEYGDPDTYICEITAHHLLADRRILYDGGALLPDHHCLPRINEKRHRDALRRLVGMCPPYVVAGSDGAIHLTKNKYRFDAFGGLNTTACDLELYIQLLAEMGVLHYADDFLYKNARRFFGDLIPPPKHVRLVRQEWTANARIPIPGTDDEATPFGFHPDPKKRFRFKWKLAL